MLSLEFNQADGILEIEWSGLIVAGVADELRTSVAKYGTALKRVVLFLDSAGGQVEEGDRVIAVLNEIKQGHRLATVVPHGKLCASMCIPIFLVGRVIAADPTPAGPRDVPVCGNTGADPMPSEVGLIGTGAIVPTWAEAEPQAINSTAAVLSNRRVKLVFISPRRQH